jgi:hypothetical protein
MTRLDTGGVAGEKKEEELGRTSERRLDAVVG